MKLRIEITIIIVVISVIASTFVITNVHDRIQCDEHDGKWTGIFGYGCYMNPNECREKGGTPIGCLPSSPGLSCAQGCQFED